MVLSLGTRLISTGVGYGLILYNLNMMESKTSGFSSSNRSFSEVRISDSIQLSSTSYLVTLALDRNTLELEVKAPSYLYISEPFANCYREFTPINIKKNSLDILVRKYPYPRGEVASYIISKSKNNTVRAHGLHYDKQITNLEEKLRGNRVELGFIANGTGISSIYQLLQWIPEAVAKGSRLTVFYADRPDEFILSNELEQLKQKYKDKLDINIIYFCPKCVTESLNDERMIRRYIEKDDIVKFLPSPTTASSKDIDYPSIFVCGSTSLMKKICGIKEVQQNDRLRGLLYSVGYNSSQVHKF